MEVIHKRLIAAQDRQKKYVDKDRKDLNFEKGDLVLLKISPWKGVTRFGKKGKLQARYVGPFEVLKPVGKVAYELALPPLICKIFIMYSMCHCLISSIRTLIKSYSMNL